MTILINDVAPRAHYVANAGQTTFSVPFEWLANSDLKVWVNEVLCTFDAPALDAMHYHTVGENTEGGGTIIFGPPGRLQGDRVIIYRDMVIDSPADFPQTGIFPVASLNAAFDEMTAGIQQAEVNVQKRTLRMADNDFLQPINSIPMVAARAGKLLGFDAKGHPVVVGKNEVGGGGGQSVWTSDTPPPQPWADGDLWWESDTGKLFVWYQDVDSSQWVQASAGGSGGGGTVTWADILGKPSTFPPTLPIAQSGVTNLTTDLAGKSDTGHSHSYASLTGIPASFTPSTHSHPQSEVTSLTTDLAARLLKAGDTMTGKLNLVATTPAGAGFNIGPTTGAAAPTTPVDGDVWIAASGVLQYRDSGGTRSVINANNTQSIGGVKTFTTKPVMTTPTTATASVNLPHGVAPTTPVDGDMWTTTAGLFIRINGVTKTVTLT